MAYRKARPRCARVALLKPRTGPPPGVLMTADRRINAAGCVAADSPGACRSWPTHTKDARAVALGFPVHASKDIRRAEGGAQVASSVGKCPNLLGKSASRFLRQPAMDPAIKWFRAVLEPFSWARGLKKGGGTQQMPVFRLDNQSGNEYPQKLTRPQIVRLQWLPYCGWMKSCSTCNR